MKVKLDSGQYKDRFDLEDDFRLMIDNAKLYNQPGQFAYLEAVELDTFFTHGAKLHMHICVNSSRTISLDAYQ